MGNGKYPLNVKFIGLLDKDGALCEMGLRCHAFMNGWKVIVVEKVSIRNWS